MSSFASSILGWLWPSRSKTSSLMCQGTARQIARRFVAALDLQEGYYTAILQQHLIVVVNAMRATGAPVTKLNVVKWSLPGNMEILHRALHKTTDGGGKWLEDYLNDLTPDLHRLLIQMRAHLAARLELADAPTVGCGTFTCAARELGGALVDLVLREVCFALVWATTIVVYATVFWLAFDRLGLAGLLGQSLSLVQCLGLGLLVTFLCNALTGRTDALAERVVRRITLQL